MYSKKRRNWSFEDLLGKAMKYCAYQERCISELKKKLYDWGASKNNSEKVIDRIIDEGFINEKRFTEFYVRGKVNVKKWGKVKIKAALKQKAIPDETIDNQIVKISEEIYLENLKHLTKKKLEELGGVIGNIEIKQKIFRYLTSKGYEFDQIKSVISDLEL